ncbi:hypothetical protein, partial [Pseudomonas sp. 21_B]|uniref:hypothetical protein n=1 Tax=Pseudomonas sp. 21_B TaxID=2813561 RepID=UPI001FB03817
MQAIGVVRLFERADVGRRFRAGWVRADLVERYVVAARNILDSPPKLLDELRIGRGHHDGFV